MVLNLYDPDLGATGYFGPGSSFLGIHGFSYAQGNLLAYDERSNVLAAAPISEVQRQRLQDLTNNGGAQRLAFELLGLPNYGDLPQISTLARGGTAYGNYVPPSPEDLSAAIWQARGAASAGGPAAEWVKVESGPAAREWTVVASLEPTAVSPAVSSLEASKQKVKEWGSAHAGLLAVGLSLVALLVWRRA